MKGKKIVAVLLALIMVVGLVPGTVFAVDDVVINEANFPDAVFRAYVLGFDTDNSNTLSEAEISAAKEIDLNQPEGTAYANKAENLIGIEYFTALETLKLDNNRLTSLDLSQNTKLTTFSCERNVYEITLEKDATNNKAYNLTKLSEEKFDPSKSSNWQGRGLPVKQEGGMLQTQLGTAQITYDYACGQDKTVSFRLQVVGDTVFPEVPITEAYFPDAAFRQYVSMFCDNLNPDGILNSEEIAKNVDVTPDDMTYNIQSLKGIEYFVQLRSLSCQNNQLKELDLSHNLQLSSLRLNNNQLSALNISQNKELTLLLLDNNELTALDLSQLSKLTTIAASGNRLTSLQFHAEAQLQYPQINNNSYPIQVDVDGVFDLSRLPSGFDAEKVSEWQNGSASAGVLTVNPGVAEVRYNYNCGANQTIILTLKVEPLYTTIDSTTFPDEAFKNYIETQFDVDPKDGKLSVAEMNAVTKIDLPAANVTTVQNVKGIEKFPNLTELICDNNKLYLLDVSQNPVLTKLSCSGNMLSSLDVSVNTALTQFSCDNNVFPVQLDSNRCFDLLGLPGDFSLTKASDFTGGTLNGSILTFEADTVSYAYLCADGRTKTFALTASDSAVIEGTPISAANFPDAAFKQYVRDNLDTDNSGTLSETECQAVKSLALAQMGITDLTGIAYFTELETLDCSYNALTALDLSSNTKLKILNCSNNQLTSLILTGCAVLNDIDCSFNKLEQLDISDQAALTGLNCTKNQLTALNLENNAVLTKLYCNYNQLTKLDLSRNTSLQYLQCNDNQLTELSVNNLPLMQLACDRNNLTELDLSECKNLADFSCVENKLTVMPITQSTFLSRLAVNGNKLTALDVSGYQYLNELNCANNALETLTLGDSDKLMTLYCQENQLTQLDVTKKTKLQTLNCSNNLLTDLNVNCNTQLNSLWCVGNKLTALDVSANAALITLDCSGNQMIALDISNCTQLRSFACSSKAGTIMMNDVRARTCDLTDLYAKMRQQNLDPDKLEWIGGSLIDDNTIKVNFGVDPLVYTYDSGNNNFSTFSLDIDYNEEYDIDEEDRKQEVEKGDSVDFRSNAGFTFFWGVWINGELVDYRYYTKRQGSTIIELSPAYINSLEPGSYSLTVLSQSESSEEIQTASTTFAVTGDPDPNLPGLPSDSDNSNNPGNSGSSTPPTELTYRNDNFATATGEFLDEAYYGREACEGDVVTLKVALSELGERFGLDFTKIEVRYEVEGATQLGGNYLYTGDPVYVDGIATDFRLGKGFNKIVAHIYYNGFKAGTCAPFYTYVQ